MKDPKVKKELAQALALQIRAMTPERFSKLVDEEVGPDLFEFFKGYSGIILDGTPMEQGAVHSNILTGMAVGYIMGRLEDSGRVIVPMSTVYRHLH